MQELMTPNENASESVDERQCEVVLHIFDTYCMGRSGS